MSINRTDKGSRFSQDRISINRTGRGNRFSRDRMLTNRTDRDRRQSRGNNKLTREMKPEIMVKTTSNFGSTIYLRKKRFLISRFFYIDISDSVSKKWSLSVSKNNNRLVPDRK